MDQFGLSKSTANRYWKILREVFGMEIYFIRNKLGHGGVYVVEDYGCFKTDWFGVPKARRSRKPKIPKTKIEDLNVAEELPEVEEPQAAEISGAEK